MEELVNNEQDSVYYSTIDMRKVLIGCLFLLFVSCSKQEKAPISEEKMIELLTDLTIASSSKTVFNRRDTIHYYSSHERILKEHGIDSLQFIKAQKIYQNNPDLYANICDSVNYRIQRKMETVRMETSEGSQEIKVIPATRVMKVSGKNKIKLHNDTIRR